mmetsp:Transcript_7870/g.7931  ORF Transcript_7870/g.7931 Transcript_7870/m.7931 type:complete len:328 (-) Transcript_7870:22-1005(-)
MSEFQYLPGLIPVILFEYFFILSMYRYRCCCKYKCCKSDNINDEDESNVDVLSHSNGEMTTFRFEDTYESFLPGLKYVLFVTRFLSFCYVGGVSVIANYAARGDTQIWFYFTTWNTELISIFFFLATTCSIIGFVYESSRVPHIDDSFDGDVYSLSTLRDAINRNNQRIIWPSSVIAFGRVVYILFQVCGGTACLVTVINFTALNPEFSFWNVSQHFITLMVMVLELFLNNMYVRADHYPFNISWAFLYLIFIWPLVVQRRISFWPYFFLKTDTYSCFFYYTGLVVANFLFYYVFYSISWLKYPFRNMVESRGSTSKDVDMAYVGTV